MRQLKIVIQKVECPEGKCDGNTPYCCGTCTRRNDCSSVCSYILGGKSHSIDDCEDGATVIGYDDATALLAEALGIPEEKMAEAVEIVNLSTAIKSLGDHGSSQN